MDFPVGNYSYPFSPETMPVWHVFVFLFGACVGSFLNVCIWRLPRDESLVLPSSHCPKCNTGIAWYDNLPLLSWSILGGKCRHCQTKISFRYFLIELLTAVMFYVIWFKVILDQQPLSVLLVYFMITMLVITTIFIDCEHHIIPNETTYPVIILGLVFSGVFPEIWGTSQHFSALAKASAGLVFGAGGMAIFAIVGRLVFKREALGWGDVKYLVAVGACLGVFGCFFTVLFGSLIGAIVGLILVLTKKGKLKSKLAFGPYLATGTYIWMVYGERLLRWYLTFLSEMAGK